MTTAYLAAIILLPVIFGGFCIIGAVTLGERHSPFKIFLFLLSLFSVLGSLWFASIVTENQDATFDALQEGLGDTTRYISYILFAIVSYFIIDLIIQVFKQAAQEKKAKLEY